MYSRYLKIVKHLKKNILRKRERVVKCYISKLQNLSRLLMKTILDIVNIYYTIILFILH